MPYPLRWPWEAIATLVLLMLATVASSEGLGILSDFDGDGVLDPVDNCPVDTNPLQSDSDGDGYGDLCDHCDGVSEAGCTAPVVGEQEVTLSRYLIDAARTDSDGDGFSNLADLCPTVSNPEQSDFDADGVGDACDACPAMPAAGFLDGCPGE